MSPVAACLVLALAQTAPSPPATAAWKVGMNWPMVVDWHPASGQPVQKFDVHILVNSLESGPDQSAAKLYFLFSANAPSHLTPILQAFYDRRTGWLLKAEHVVLGKAARIPLDKLGPLHVSKGAPAGLPLDLLPPTMDYPAAVSKVLQEDGSWEVVLEHGGVRLWQRWKKDDVFWREGKQWIDNRLIYHARRKVVGLNHRARLRS